MDNTTDARPDALELGENEVKESHPLSAENFPHSYFSARSEKWVVKNTIQNLEHFLKYHGIVIRLNEMNYRVVVSMGNHIEYSAPNLDHFVVIKSLLAEAGYERVLNVNDYATQIGLKNMYHPIRDWIDSKPLVTTGNIKRLVTALNTSNPELTESLLTTWMISGIAAWFHKDGVAAQGMLTLCGKTGMRKTTFFKGLLPSGMVLEGHVLNANNIDSRITALSYGITEVGEVGASVRASGNDSLKGFLTTQTDSMRVPYGRVDTIKPRRTIFGGTVNDPKFLTDETGSRRYWVIDIDSVIDTEHGIDMQQLWAEAKALYLSGRQWHLTYEQEATVSEVNKTYEVENPMEELLLARYDWDAPRIRWFNCAEIIIALGLPIGQKSVENKMRSALRKMASEAVEIKTKRTKKGLVYNLPRLLPM